MIKFLHCQYFQFHVIQNFQFLSRSSFGFVGFYWQLLFSKTFFTEDKWRFFAFYNGLLFCVWRVVLVVVSSSIFPIVFNFCVCFLIGFYGLSKVVILQRCSVSLVDL